MPVLFKNAIIRETEWQDSDISQTSRFHLKITKSGIVFCGTPSESI